MAGKKLQYCHHKDCKVLRSIVLGVGISGRVEGTKGWVISGSGPITGSNGWPGPGILENGGVHLGAGGVWEGQDRSNTWDGIGLVGGMS